MKLAIEEVFDVGAPPKLIEYLRDIESGARQPDEHDLYGLWQHITFCPDTAMAILEGKPHQVCRICACSDRDACVDHVKGNCWWIAEDLCSHCEGREA